MIYTLIFHPKLTHSTKWLLTNRKLLKHYKTRINLFKKSKCKSQSQIKYYKNQKVNSRRKLLFWKSKWQLPCRNSTDVKHMANPNAIQQSETSTSSKDITPRTTENRSKTPKPQTKEIVTPPNIVTPNIPTKNRFLPLQNSMNESDTLPNREDIDSTSPSVRVTTVTWEACACSWSHCTVREYASFGRSENNGLRHQTITWSPWRLLFSKHTKWRTRERKSYVIVCNQYIENR